MKDHEAGHFYERCPKTKTPCVSGACQIDRCVKKLKPQAAISDWAYFDAKSEGANV